MSTFQCERVKADRIGYMSDYKPIPRHIIEEDIAKLILYSAANVRGVFICNREQFKTMNRALEVGGVKPIIDKVRFSTGTEVIWYRANYLDLQVRAAPGGLSVHGGWETFWSNRCRVLGEDLRRRE